MTQGSPEPVVLNYRRSKALRFGVLMLTIGASIVGLAWDGLDIHWQSPTDDGALLAALLISLVFAFFPSVGSLTSFSILCSSRTKRCAFCVFGTEPGDRPQSMTMSSKPEPDFFGSDRDVGDHNPLNATFACSHQF